MTVASVNILLHSEWVAVRCGVGVHLPAFSLFTFYMVLKRGTNFYAFNIHISSSQCGAGELNVMLRPYMATISNRMKETETNPHSQSHICAQTHQHC